MAIEVTVPATIANLGPGFDTLGMAVDVYDRFRMALAERGTVSFTGEGAAGLDREATPLVVRATEAVARRVGRSAAFATQAYLSVPVARGLGSSAASIVGGLVGANHLLGNPLEGAVLLELAADLEGHPDNVAAALLGGVVVVLPQFPHRVQQGVGRRDGEGLRGGIGDCSGQLGADGAVAKLPPDVLDE